MFAYPPYLQPLDYYSLPAPQEVIQKAAAAKASGKKIVIASGVFDLLHDAHKKYLENAKKAGDYLVVLVESDERTRLMKGDGRPVWSQIQRRQAILDLPFVDDVLILPPEFSNPLRWEEIVILLAPDIYAESSNSVALDHKQKLLEKYGGKVEIVLQEIPGISTTQLLAGQKSA